jgi:hypothetical protein
MCFLDKLGVNVQMLDVYCFRSHIDCLFTRIIWRIRPQRA